MRDQVRFALIEKFIRHLEPVIGEISPLSTDGITSKYAEVSLALEAVIVEERVTLEEGAPLLDEY